MAADGNYFVYETIPYSYSPLGLAGASPLDNYDSLTRSMRDLTTYADLIARALAADTDPQSSSRRRSKAASDDASSRQDANARSAPADAFQLCLRPSIHWRQSAEGFVLSAATPGLRKDELKVELLDDQGESYIEVSGQSVDKQDQHSSKDGQESQAEAASPKETKLELRATYRGFSERVRLPRGVDREAMRATYEDGLLLVTIPMKKADAAKRQKITIA